MAKIDLNEAEAYGEEAVESELLVSNEVVSGEFQGPWRMGRARRAVADEEVVSGEFQGPWRMGKAGRAMADAMRKARQYTSSVLRMVTCISKEMTEANTQEAS